jgi:type I restriction enzyme S subunit
MKTLLRERSEKGFPDEPLLAATQTKGVVRKENYENRTVLALKDLHLLKLVRAGDFVISLRSFQGGIEYAREQGIISPAYTILYPIEEEAHGYLSWLFKSKPYVQNLSLFVTGIRQGQNVDYERLARSELPLPPAEDRYAIVRFLDHADRRVRRAIRARQKLVTLLNEQKQAVIHRAVTHGLDSAPKLKPLGSIPDFDVNAGWEVRRLWRIARVRSEKNHPELSLLSVFLGRGVIPYGEGGGQVHKPSLELSDYQVVYPGDLVLNNQQAWRGSVGVSEHRGIVSPAYVVLELGNALDRGFAAHLFQSRALVSQFVTASKGVGDIQRDVHTPWLKNVCVPIPPSDEQRTIASYLDDKLVDISADIARGNRGVELLLEYRTCLISDVVTGKLDAREAAAHLPDELDQPEPADEGDVQVADDTDVETLEPVDA